MALHSCGMILKLLKLVIIASGYFQTIPLINAKLKLCILGFVLVQLNFLLQTSQETNNQIDISVAESRFVTFLKSIDIAIRTDIRTLITHYLSLTRDYLDLS